MIQRFKLPNASILPSFLCIKYSYKHTHNILMNNDSLDDDLEWRNDLELDKEGGSSNTYVVNLFS